MRNILVLCGFATLAVLFLSTDAAAQTSTSSAEVDTCVSCHLQIGDEMAAPVNQIRDDVHGQLGFSCTSCHGGDSSETDRDRSMDPRKGYIGKPSPSQVSAVCGMCHVAEPMEYSASVHGRRIAAGDTRSATCVSCHGAHGIYEVKDSRSSVYPTRVSDTCGQCHSNADYMKPYDIPVNQATKYRASVHAAALYGRQDLSAPTCNDCHGNHNIEPVATGAAAKACGGCHVRNAELFDSSPHKDGFEALGIASCTTCHSNHEVLHPTDADVGIEEGATCVICHSQGEPGYAAALTIHRTLTYLDRDITESSALLDRAARAGMEVSGARFDLSGARDSLLNARVVMHAFSAQQVGQTAAMGLTLADKAHASGIAALQDLQYRRKGLGVALLVIGLAVVAVYLKIRQIEAPSSNREDQ